MLHAEFLKVFCINGSKSICSHPPLRVYVSLLREQGEGVLSQYGVAGQGWSSDGHGLVTSSAFPVSTLSKR